MLNYHNFWIVTMNHSRKYQKLRIEILWKIFIFPDTFSHPWLSSKLWWKTVGQRWSGLVSHCGFLGWFFGSRCLVPTLNLPHQKQVCGCTEAMRHWKTAFLMSYLDVANEVWHLGPTTDHLLPVLRRNIYSVATLHLCRCSFCFRLKWAFSFCLALERTVTLLL